MDPEDYRQLTVLATWEKIAGLLQAVMDEETADLSDWSQYPKVVTADHVLRDVSDLALMLGGDATSFTGDVLALVAKARFTPQNLNRLCVAFPRHVCAFLMWQTLSFAAPITAGELVEILSWAHVPPGGRRGDDVISEQPERKDQP